MIEERFGRPEIISTSIEFQQVRFKYPTRKERIFQSLSFKINPQ